MFGSLRVQESGQRGEHADAVILPVAADKGGIKADVARRAGGHGLQFGGHQILFADAVLTVEEGEDVRPDRIFLFFCGFIRIGSGRQRAVPQDHVELFRVKGVGHGLVTSFCARCGSRSAMVNTGSPGSSPSTTLMDVPSSLMITPCRARGRASH